MKLVVKFQIIFT